VPPLADLNGLSLSSCPGGPWGWPDTLPVDASRAVRLAEGNTPNVRIPSTDPGRHLWIKDESRNPTGSHKDRAMSVGLTRALEVGASTVVAASSGNAGASAAAYAARAGLRCVVLTTPAISQSLAVQIAAFGAVLVAFDEVAARDELAEAAVTELGWYPVTNIGTPAVGGNPFGIEGYRSVAYELARDFGDDIDTVVVPTSRADLLAGIGRGYGELATARILRRTPRLVAAETATGAGFSAALAHRSRLEQELSVAPEVPSPAFSLGSSRPTWQGLQALWNTGGTAMAIDPDEYMTEHRRLPAKTGLFLETSSSVGVAAGRRLLEEDEARAVVLIGTATGLKGHPAEAPSRPLVLVPHLHDLVDHCDRRFELAGRGPV
jgi:threonine synthase